mgnify:CR=1 FL=1
MSVPVKMAIVWRNELKVRLGKKMAQAGHAAHLWLTSKIKHVDQVCDWSRKDEDMLPLFGCYLTEDEVEWVKTNYPKIVLSVETEADLLVLKEKAESLGIKAQLVVDDGLTEFGGVKTTTCLAIGPAKSADIDMITGEKGPLGRLKLM